MPKAVHGKDARLFASIRTVTNVDNISRYLNKESLPRMRDVYDVTTQGAASKEYISGLTDATFSFGGPFISIADEKFSEWMAEAEIQFAYFPAGVPTATFGVGTDEKPIYTGRMFLTEYSLDCPVGDKISVSSGAQIIGVPTRIDS